MITKQEDFNHSFWNPKFRKGKLTGIDPARILNAVVESFDFPKIPKR